MQKYLFVQIQIKKILFHRLLACLVCHVHLQWCLCFFANRPLPQMCAAPMAGNARNYVLVPFDVGRRQLNGDVAIAILEYARLCDAACS